MKIRCRQCEGRKKIYQLVCGGYTKVNTGGKLIDCRLCKGTGEVEVVVEDPSKVSKKAKKNAKLDNVKDY